jgi:predicted GNAT superfamily acetyltransferase
MNESLSLESFGFLPVDHRTWRKTVHERTFTFRELKSLEELEIAERMQREVMMIEGPDVVMASFLVVAPDTGGFTLGAFEGDREIAVAFSYGGYQHPEAFLYSDFLVVVTDARSIGIGFEMKRLQALLAMQRGFAAVRWTVDPLRAANARLNLERLGALGITYTRNKYGSDFASGLYGGMPTDRLLLRWPLRTERTAERLLRDYLPRPDGALDGLEEISARSIGAPQLVVTIPGDIDSLVQADFESAMRYRMETREKIELAFDAGYFVSGAARAGAVSRLLLEPAAMFEESGDEA